MKHTILSLAAVLLLSPSNRKHRFANLPARVLVPLMVWYALVAPA